MRRALVVVAALLLAACPGRSERRAAAPPPVRSGNEASVLLITIDTLRADHLGAYGYPRPTSPGIDALGRQGTVFEQAFTYWPKTRGSFAAMLTGRYASMSGYGKRHPMILDFNPTLASVLKAAGYRTAAVVDNPNVAAKLGYAKGFDSYRETWEEEDLATEMDRTRAITEAGIRFLRETPDQRPFLLWLHYVNPHAPYTPPPPYDTAFLGEADEGPMLPVVPGLHGGIPRRWAVAGKDRLGYYVSQYDGEIAAVDAEVARVVAALRESGKAAHTVVVLTADHGESLGEHDYYFDHGEDLFDPCLKIPLIVVAPGGPSGRRSHVLASTLDVMPTILDAVKVSYPPELAGRSLLHEVLGEGGREREELFAQNDRNLTAAWNRRFKLVATPQADGGARLSLFDRVADPGETRDVAPVRPGALARERDALSAFQRDRDREWSATRRLTEGKPGQAPLSREACEKLAALGYVGGCGGTP